MTEIGVPRPFSADAMATHVAQMRGRPITILPTLPHTIDLCGVVVVTKTRDVILHRPTAAHHREHIVLHELGHLLCDHPCTGTGTVPASWLSTVAPDLDPRISVRFLGRGGPHTPHEEEAELMAWTMRRLGHAHVDTLGHVLSDP